MYIDTHCHLDYFSDEEIEEIVARAREAGVGAILSDGISKQTNRKTLKLAEKYPEVKACLGIYPIDGLDMESKDIDAEIDFIRNNAEKVIAIGEVGMDMKESDEVAIQERNFRKFVSLSMDLDKPVVVHSRKAEERCINILEDMGAKKVLMHCFSGKKKLIERIVENGWYFSIPGNIARSEQFKGLVEMVPIGQLLCETDSPFLHPSGGARNEPGNVVVSYEEIAETKGLSVSEVEREIEGNFNKLFG
jgi:TatD DNase family protein